MKSDMKRKKSSNLNVNELNISNNPNRAFSMTVNQDFETSECVKFVQCIRKSLKMFYIENIFIGIIFDSKENFITNKILERIYDPVLRFLKLEAEVKKISLLIRF
jgi:hypothetical protein